MGNRITHLGEWRREIQTVRQEWLDVQACTEPADRDEAEFGIALAYESAGLTPPSTVIWTPDPALGATVVAELAMFRLARKVWTEALDNARRVASRTYTTRAWREASAASLFPDDQRVEQAIRSAALGLVFTTRNSKNPDVDAELNRLTSGSARRLERARFDASMAEWGRYPFWSHGSLGHRRLGLRIIEEAFGKTPQATAVRSSVRYGDVRQALDWARGQHETLQALAVHDALSRLYGEDSLACVAGLVRVARSAGWWWPLHDIAVVCDRPSVRALDREGRLHAEDGPALAYPGGFSAYFWHGRIVPRWVVREPTVEGILAEPNVEVRRCAIEALGWARFIGEAGLKLIDECADPGNPGQWLGLYSVPGKVWGNAANVLMCTNGSLDLDGGRHTFGLLVPVTVRTALGAAAWGYGLTAEEYAGLQRRA